MIGYYYQFCYCLSILVSLFKCWGACKCLPCATWPMLTLRHIVNIHIVGGGKAHMACPGGEVQVHASAYLKQHVNIDVPAEKKQ
jgi:hypothetical protein